MGIKTDNNRGINWTFGNNSGFIVALNGLLGNDNHLEQFHSSSRSGCYVIHVKNTADKQVRFGFFLFFDTRQRDLFIISADFGIVNFGFVNAVVTKP